MQVPVRITTRAFMIFIPVFTGACAAPFAELQSARLAGPGRVELTPAYSHMDVTDEGETAKIQDVFAVHIATGITNRVDVRARFDHIRVDGDDGANVSATAIGIGPKFGIIPNQLALYAPVGFATGSEIEMSETWQFHPSLIWTIPVSRSFEINSAIKALIPISSDNDGVSDNSDDVLAALNVGLGISPDLSRWVFRPEVGFLKNPGEEGTIRHFSLGLTLYLGDRR